MRHLIKNVATVSAVGLALFCDLAADRARQNTPPTSEPASTQPVLSITSPPSSQTTDSIAVLWEKPSGAGVTAYDVYRGSDLIATTTNTDYTLQNLSPATAYDISIQAHLKTGDTLHSNTLRITTKPPSEIFDITKYGAVGDGTKLDTAEIQAAINACTPGGTLRIPAGVFLSGAIFLKSNMTLHLDDQAVLMGSANTTDYPLMKYRFEGRETTGYASLINTPPINATRWKNITIDGPGTINANGSALRKKELKEAAGKPGRALCIRDTDGVYLHSITVRQSPAWCVHLIYCNAVAINTVTINTRSDETGKKYSGIVNGDGLDPDSCGDVNIFNSQITTEDDCISLKSGRDAEGRAVGIPTENVRISNCHFNSGFGIAMGSEMSGGLRNVLVEDCTFQDTFSLASVKAIRGRGSIIENITYRDCSYTSKDPGAHNNKWFRGALYVDQFYGDAKFDLDHPKTKDEGTPLIRNLLFENITLDTAAGNAIYMTGLPESPLENIRLQNVTAIGEHGFIANNIRGLILDNVSVDARDGNAMRFHNVR